MTATNNHKYNRDNNNRNNRNRDNNNNNKEGTFSKAFDSWGCELSEWVSELESLVSWTLGRTFVQADSIHDVIIYGLLQLIARGKARPVFKLTLLVDPQAALIKRVQKKCTLCSVLEPGSARRVHTIR